MQNNMKVRYETIGIDMLQNFTIRDIRGDAVAKLVERIENGYNHSKPLTVVERDGKYIVANGNHRLEALRQLGITEVPCVIYDGADPYRLAVQGNEDEDTYSPMDLFDWLGVIETMKGEGKTQQEIADSIGMSRSKVNNYQLLTNEIDTNILERAKAHQKDRVSANDTNVSFSFTEGWFRNSGLYDLEPQYQHWLLDEFIADRFNWNSSKVQKESAKYKQWQEFKMIALEKLVNRDDYSAMIDLIEGGVFRNEAQLLSKINDFNSKAENKLICGDAIQELEKLEDNSIDLVITDPPYGIDYSSNFGIYENHVTKESISNDADLDVALKLLDDTLNLLHRKTKENAHVYIFSSWKVYPQFQEIVSKYFNVKNMIVWYKTDAGIGDLEGSWINGHELIIFATKGNRKINRRRSDVISINRMHSSDMIHPTQKPIGLIHELLSISAQSKDTIIDPFMGSGSTIKAAVQYGDLNYIGIELDKERFDKAVSFIGG